MNLLYATPLALTLHYFTLWFYGSTSLESLFAQFYEADRKNVDLTSSAGECGAGILEPEAYDFIVVGAGSAGSAVASRLSENENHRVLLLEVGGNPFPICSVPSMIFKMLRNPDIDWADKIVPQKNACLAFTNNAGVFSRGKGLGGSTNLNWMVAMRGNPNDFNRWADEADDDSWRFENMLRHFKKMETYRGDYPSAEYHGTEGPLNIDPNIYAPLKDEWLEAGKELGYEIKDPNGAEQAESFFPLVVTMKNGTRFSTQRAYLYPAMMRKNLVVKPYSTATKIELDANNKAIGVHYESIRDGKRIQNYATSRKEIVLSAGAFGSPKLLMLSGIGPKDHLESKGIVSKIDLPVGQNLQDHPIIFVGPFEVDRKKTTQPNLERDFNEHSVHQYLSNQTGRLAASSYGLGGGALIASSLGTHDWPDLYYTLMSMKMTHDMADTFQKIFDFKPGVLQKYFAPVVGKDVFFNTLCLCLPKTVGEVKLRSSDPHEPMDIDPKYLDHQDDVTMMLEGVKLAVKISLETKAMQKIGAKLTTALFPGCESFGNANVDNDGYWDCFQRHWTQTMWHYTSTCKMGKKGDGNSVVDGQLRVHGVQGLRVADNSIQPKVVTTNTNLPAIVIGEKAADMIKTTWKGKSAKAA